MWRSVPIKMLLRTMLTSLGIFCIAHAPAQNLPYATQRAAQQFPVTLYTGNDCASLCQNARQYLQKRGVPYTEKVVTTNTMLAELKKLVGDASIPSLQIGRTGFAGFSESTWNAQLSAAGYPNTPLPNGYTPRVINPEEPATPPTSSTEPARPSNPASDTISIPSAPPPRDAPPGFRF